MGTRIYKNKLLYIAIFFIFLGFYAGILAFASAKLLFLSRYFTIPVRMLLLLCLAGVFYRSKVAIRDKISFFLFLSFASLYLLRIIADSVELNIYYIGTGEHIFYFLAFAAFPFVFINNSFLIKKDYDISLKAFFLSAFLFSAFASIFYLDLVGSVGRLNRASNEGEAIISPLILSYCSTLAIGVCLSYLLENKMEVKRVVYLLFIIALSVVPFFLGASRGSLFALFLPFMFVFIGKGNAVSNLKITVVMIIVLALVVLLAQELGSKLIDRFTSVSEDISNQSTSAIRLEMWKQSFRQFSDNPIFGDSFLLQGFNNYPHNVLLEVLQTTGLFGFIPFIILIFRAILKCFKIFRFSPKYSWIGIIFLQAFFQALFSGGLHSSAWLWFSLGLVLQFNIKRVNAHQADRVINVIKQ